jgi:hypothetical protein
MPISLDDHIKKLAPEWRARIAARTRALIAEAMTLRDLRQAEHLAQERRAELMDVEQASVSRLERRADLLLSTLSSYVAAMGGKLRPVAEFPNRRPVAIALADVTDDVFQPHRRGRPTRTEITAS